MLFYADRVHSLDPLEVRDQAAESLASVARAYLGCPDPPRRVALETHPDLVSATISLGELHQAVADLYNPSLDDAHPEVDRLAAAAVLLGRCVYLSAELLQPGPRARRPRFAGETPAVPELLMEASRAVALSLPSGLPSHLDARVPEGYAFYCLYPEMYLSSLSRALEVQSRRAAYTVIGIRSIGTSLAALVAGALLERGIPARVETLRPRGHPFNRFIHMAPTLQERLSRDACNSSGFIVVDEGPGLTCSSFLSVCSALSSLGVAEEQLTILSAWRGAPSVYASAEIRARWRRLPVFCTDASDAFDGWRRLLPFFLRAVDSPLETPEYRILPLRPQVVDLGYGRWRERLYPSPEQWPAVHRSTERVKLLVDFSCREAGSDTVGGALMGRNEGSERHGTFLAKFAGLGEYGKRKLERAQVLAEAGFAPPVEGLAYGFLLYRFLPEAQPMSVADLSPSLMARMVDYYAFLARRFPLAPSPRFDQLAEVIALNVRETIGADASPFLACWRPYREAIDALPLALLDGRPQPHEWLRLGSGPSAIFLKADSADHFSDHTLVGEQSILWDLAGACEEWEMNPETRSQMMILWEEETGDGRAPRLLDFYRAAYLAFRAAALHYAVHSTDEDDIRQSLQHQEWSYRQRLRELIANGW